MLRHSVQFLEFNLIKDYRFMSNLLSLHKALEIENNVAVFNRSHHVAAQGLNEKKLTIPDVKH